MRNRKLLALLFIFVFLSLSEDTKAQTSSFPYTYTGPTINYITFKGSFQTVGKFDPQCQSGTGYTYDNIDCALIRVNAALKNLGTLMTNNQCTFQNPQNPIVPITTIVQFDTTDRVRVVSSDVVCKYSPYNSANKTEFITILGPQLLDQETPCSSVNCDFIWLPAGANPVGYVHKGL